LELEDAFVKMAFMQFGAMKCLSTILTCNYFSEFILVPKQKWKTTKPSSSEKKEEEKEAEEKETDDLVNEKSEDKICTKCEKIIPAALHGECPYCIDSLSLQAAVTEAFKYLVKVWFFHNVIINCSYIS